MPSDLVNHESSSLSVAAEPQSHSLAAATLRHCLSSPATTGISSTLPHGGIRKRADCRVSKPPIRSDRRRPGFFAPTASAQDHPIARRGFTIHKHPFKLSENVRYPTLALHPGRYCRPADQISHTSYLIGSSQPNMHLPSPQGLQKTGGWDDAAVMLRRLDEYFWPPNQELNGNDHSRKILLREAIQNNDFFYLVLSQVFCLYSLRDDLVAQVLGEIPESSWSCLGELLCSNKCLSLSGVGFFATFPAPVAKILDSQWCQSFLARLHEVKDFLHHLPPRWHRMIQASRDKAAPPLTQDMVDDYSLKSPIIQTTMFRAMVRSFWGWDNPGSKFLETIHKIDQYTYTECHWRRSRREKLLAYGSLTKVYQVWQPLYSRPEADWKEYWISAAYKFFKTRPSSMEQTPSLGANGGHGQLSQGGAQEAFIGGCCGVGGVSNRIGIEAVAGAGSLGVCMNRHIVETSGSIPEQHRTLMRNNGSPAAQHLLSPSSCQYPKHQPMQLCQLQLGSLSVPEVLQSRGAASPQHRDMPETFEHRPSIRPPPHSDDLVPSANTPGRPLPVQPDTAHVSLHQAYLRSPIPGNPQLSAPLLYRHVTGFALPPTQLDRNLYAQSIIFSVSEANLSKPSITSSGLLPVEPGIRTLQEGSFLYRLRCCELSPGKEFDTEASWVAARGTWPDIYTFKLNETYLEPRRNLHDGRCLPVDLSSLLQPGSNTLSVYTVPNPSNPDTSNYIVAIERVSVSSHTSIASAVTHIPATNSLAAIKRSLVSPPDEDDDIAITSSTLTISLFDTYWNDRICNNPVRGSACLHRECFDLETFLSQYNREQPGEPCVPNYWRCPICKGDVRPQTLVEDGFLVQVKEELTRKGLLGTRAIIVEADGSWKPKVEARLSEVHTASLACEEAAAVPVMMAAAADSRSSISAGGQGKLDIVDIVVLD